MNDQYCTIYLARHGETEWNIAGRLQVHTDSPLTENGINQAKDLTKSLSRIKFSAVYSSDLSRAYKTAEYLATDQDLTVVTTNLLRERFFGRYEGKPWVYFQKKLSKLIELNQGQLTKNMFHSVDPQIESDDHIADRLIRFLREVALAHLKQNILVVTHGGSIRSALLHMGYLLEKDLTTTRIENTAYAILHSDGTEFDVINTSGIDTH